MPHLMENLFPTCVKDYCSYFEINFLDLSLPCIFCRFRCNIVDLAQFYSKQLRLIWRNNIAFACCEKCLKLCAKYEFEQHCVCSVRAEHLHGLIRVPMDQVLLRCTYCFAVLTASEKVDLVAGSRYVWLIRGYWRAMCSKCRQLEN